MNLKIHTYTFFVKILYLTSTRIFFPSHLINFLLSISKSIDVCGSMIPIPKGSYGGDRFFALINLTNEIYYIQTFITIFKQEWNFLDVYYFICIFYSLLNFDFCFLVSRRGLLKLF